MLPVSINPTVPTSLSTKTIANHRVFFSGQYCGDADDGAGAGDDECDDAEYDDEDGDDGDVGDVGDYDDADADSERG